jgi:NAD(P)-dependent dehydrogenase (short-subunit alcohol dehydrogenase family)
MTAAGSVLITGCSSGIGQAAALALHEAGRTVVATARNPATLSGLANRGLRTLALDVTDEASMRAAVDAAGPIDVLVNNAGYGLYGTVEQLPMAEIRRQFETNFFGLVRLTQLVLPGMRAAGGGRILNVSSMGGRATLPGGAFYHASKYAVEALSDALRMEVARFGIHVVLIEPGPVRTPWNDVAAGSVAASAANGSPANGSPANGSPANGSPANGNGNAADPYAGFKDAVTAAFSTATDGPLARFSSSADDIAKVITRAVTARRPRTRYLINPVARTTVTLRRWLPDRAYDAVLRRQYHLP